MLFSDEPATSMILYTRSGIVILPCALPRRQRWVPPLANRSTDHFVRAAVELKACAAPLFDGTKAVIDLSRRQLAQLVSPVITGSPIPTSLADDVDRRRQVVISAVTVDQHQDASASARRGFL